MCVAAAVAGATSQDLKTGYLVGATPARQQIGLLFGVTTSAMIIGGMIAFLNNAKTTEVARDYPGVTVTDIETGARDSVKGVWYRVGHLIERTGEAPAGHYLVDSAGAIAYLVDPGIGGREPKDARGFTKDKLDSPKAQIMALVVDGILTQKLPWGLILIGAFIAVVIEILGIPSLPVAVGVYLPISTSATMFMGGMVRWIVERKMDPAAKAANAGDSGPGVLFSSGLIAGGAIMGVVIAAFQAKGTDTMFDMSHLLPALSNSALAAMVIYVLALSYPLFRVGRRMT